MAKLAIFDVDYTLTKKETLMEFYKFMMKKNKKLIKHLPFSLGSAFFYVLKVFDAKKAKENFIRFVDGIEEKEMETLVKEFYKEKLSCIIYKDAYDTMKKLKSEGCLIYLISASAEFYLNELYNIKEVDKIIGTRFRVNGGLHTRFIEGENCKGEEKVNRLKEELLKDNIEVNFKDSYMFSDSLSDMPLFKMVGHPYLVNPKKSSNEIQALKWK